MDSSRPFVAPALGVLVTATLVWFSTGCDDETSPGTPPATLENIWPNENGRKWEYARTTKIFEDVVDSSAIYPDPGDVPPAPEWADILPLLDHPTLPDSVRTATISWGLEFQDSTTTLSGVTAQNLVELPDTVSVPLLSASKTRPRSAFLSHLLRARPDLRGRISDPAGTRIYDEFETLEPLNLLHGGAWEKTAAWIGTYGDLDSELAWKYLDANLTPGHEFTHQLISTVVNDVFLHGLVRREVTVETAAGTFHRALEVVYLIDFGVSEATEPLTGDPIGYFRVVDYGKVLYVPTIGPVTAYERLIVSVGETLGTGYGEVSVELTEVTPGPTPF